MLKSNFLCDRECKEMNEWCDLKMDCYDNIDEQNCLKSKRCSQLKNSIKDPCSIKVNYMGNVLYKPGYPFTNRDYCISFNCSFNEYKCYNKGYCISLDW